MCCLGRILNVSCHEHHVNYFCVVLERIIYVVNMTARQPFENDTPGYGETENKTKEAWLMMQSITFEASDRSRSLLLALIHILASELSLAPIREIAR